MIRPRLLPWAILAAALAGCQAAPRGACQTNNRLPVTELVDRERVDDAVPLVDVALCEALAARVNHSANPADAPARCFNVLVLSGGGAYGAYPAGILCGWAEAGTRPSFDVVTGVSTGALVATLAFLGPARDPDLRRFYTTVTNKDVFAERRPEIAGVLGESLADSAPLERLINSVADERLLAEVAAEHAKGRRLYVGTTHLDSRRLVVWDMGAIATRGGPVYLGLFRKVLLASASIPGFFPPVRVPVEVDGQAYEELHVDGGVTAALFFRPPVVKPDQVPPASEHPLAGSNVYIIVAGKLFADPGCVSRRFTSIAANSISALLYAQTRGDLFQLFALCLAGRMKYNLTGIPAGAPAPADSTTFDPAEMTRLFEYGRQSARAGSPWRSNPPGLAQGEQVPVRSDVLLTVRPGATAEPTLTPAAGTKRP
jgi:predicted acylesterase/phospholipase RssA